MVESISECDFFHLTVIWRKAWWEESSEGAEEKVGDFQGSGSDCAESWFLNEAHFVLK